MFGVTLRDHMMIAHSLSGEAFGRAQRLHGATYVVDATITASALDDLGLVVDIGQAATVLADVLAAFTLRNLDDEPSLSGLNTTTERLAEVVAGRLVDRVRRGELGTDPERLSTVRVTLHESHVASAFFERAL